MSSVLPQGRIEATRVDPRISIFYGPPKIGKTTKVAELDNNLLLDCERGTEMISAVKIPISSISGETTWKEDGAVAFTSIDQVESDMIAYAVAKAKETGTKPKPPYKYLTVDTIDKLEEFCEVTATYKYKQTTIGKNFDGKSVIELPQGSGYYHLRNEVILQIDRLSMLCEHLILISHIREKLLNKGGVDVAMQDISLTGKLGAMVCAKADLIGYVYRDSGKEKKLMVSFETLDNNVMGARIPRLAGKRIPFDWNEIFTGKS